MNSKLLREKGMKAWAQVKTLEDVWMWHKIYTPYWSDKDIKEIIIPKYLEMEEKGPRDDQKLEYTEFEKAMLDSF